MYSEIDAVILSGGKSSRMGADKSFLKIGPDTLIERTKNLLVKIFQNVSVSTNDIDSYSFLGLKMIEDIQKNTGPLAGIHAALKNLPAEKIFFISCDLPFMNEDTIRYLAEYITQKPIVIPSAQNRIQQLCGIYSKDILPLIEKIFSEPSVVDNRSGKKSVSVKRLIETAGAEIINMERLPFYNENVFYNMNSEADYKRVKELIRD